MGPKGMLIVEAAAIHRDWTQDELAAHFKVSRNTVKVVLHKARREGLIKTREIDVERTRYRRLRWLPEERRAEYFKLCSQFKAAEARAIIEADLQAALRGD